MNSQFVSNFLPVLLQLHPLRSHQHSRSLAILILLPYMIYLYFTAQLRFFKCLTMKIESAHSSKTLVTICQSAWEEMPGDLNLYWMLCLVTSQKWDPNSKSIMGKELKKLEHYMNSILQLQMRIAPYTVTSRITTFQSTDCIYGSGPIILWYYNIIL